MKKLSILFVCTENICRSPMAHGVMRTMLDQRGLKRLIRVDSAGTTASQRGHQPDVRGVKVAKEFGVKLKGIKARRIVENDFQTHDYILAMDKVNLNDLLERCPSEYAHKIHLIMAFAPHLNISEVPDPYYGNFAGFRHVFDLISEANNGLLAEVEARLRTV